MVKLTVILLLFSTFQSIAFEGTAQIRVTLTLNDVDLKKAFKEIERQTIFKFIYNDDALPLDKKVNISATDRPVEEVVQQLLQKISLTYKFLGKNLIVIGIKPGNQEKKEQDKVQITGKVSDPEGKPLSGINIIEKGTGNGTTTGTDGNFAIAVENEKSILVFSSIGYLTREITVGSLSSLSVELTPRINTQEEVVVVGYGRQRRRDITGSVASVKGDELNKAPLTTLDQKLQGQVAGVQVMQTSGNPGGGTTIRVRGQGTIGNNQPLFVIDGFPIVENTGFEVNPLSTINPEDIESIEVLKDASSTAIYGSRGSNGVVLITTKKGRAGKPKVELSASAGFQQIAKKIPVLNAREMAELYVEARTNGWNDRVDLRPASQSEEAYFNTPNANRGGFRIFNAFLDPGQYGAGTNWQDEIFRTAPMSNYQLNVSGGSDKVRYLFGGGFFDQQGIVINSGFKRYAFRANIDGDISNRIKIGINLAPSFVTSDIAQTQGHFNAGSIVTTSLTMSPLIPVYNPDGSYGHQMGRSDMNLATVFNPVALAREATRKRSSGRMIGNAYLDIELATGLKFRTSAGVDYINDRGRNFVTSQWGTATPPPTNPSANSFAAQSISWLNENTLSYQKRTGNHNIDAIAGFTSQRYNTERISNGRAILPNDLIPYVVGPSDQGQTVAEGFSLLSYLGRVNYSLLDRYLITATLRRDGSSLIPCCCLYFQVFDFFKGYRIIYRSPT